MAAEEEVEGQGHLRLYGCVSVCVHMHAQVHTPSC